MTKFIELKAKYLCQIYFVNFKNKDSIQFKIKSRYYYKTTFIYIENNTTSITKKACEKKFLKHNILLKTSTLKKIIFNFNIIISKLSDLAYNKYFKIVRRIIFVLCIKILISKTLEAFIKEFCLFSLLTY